MTGPSSDVDRPPAIGQQEVSAAVPETSSQGGDGAARWDQGSQRGNRKAEAEPYSEKKKGRWAESGGCLTYSRDKEAYAAGAE